MYHNNVATLPQFSGLERVVGPWFPDISRKCPEESEATWFLIGRSASQNAVQVIPIRVSPFRVGRDDGTDLPIPSLEVSRFHAELFARGGRLQIRDLSSRNGTFVDGQRIADNVIVESDALLQFANVPFRVCLVSEADTNMNGESRRARAPQTVTDARSRSR